MTFVTQHRESFFFFFKENTLHHLEDSPILALFMLDRKGERMLSRCCSPVMTSSSWDSDQDESE